MIQLEVNTHNIKDLLLEKRNTKFEIQKIKPPSFLYRARTVSNDNSSKKNGDPVHIFKIPHH